MGKLPVNPERVAIFHAIKSSPRVRMAARLYASAAVPTKKAACEAVGLSPYYLSILSRASVQNPEVTSIIGEVDQAIHDKTIAMSAVIALMARRAADKMNKLMDSNNEHVAFKSAADILDRNPETSKTQKLQVSSFSLESADAKELASALVRAAEVNARFAKVGEGDFVKIPQELPDGKGATQQNLNGDREARSTESVQSAKDQATDSASEAADEVSKAVGIFE